MALSKLNLNPDKPEFIVFGSNVQRQKLSSHFPVNILGSLLHPANTVKDLGVWFDAASFPEHIQMTCKACFPQMLELDSFLVLSQNTLGHIIKHGKYTRIIPILSNSSGYLSISAALSKPHNWFVHF